MKISDGPEPRSRRNSVPAVQAAEREPRGRRSPVPAVQSTLELDDAACRVIEHRGSPLLVLGGPGTGKTTLLEQRYLGLASEASLAPHCVLVLCNNRTYSAEARSRLFWQLPHQASVEVPVYTWHAFAYHLVSRYYRRLGYAEQPVLLPGPEQWGFVKGLLTEEDRSAWRPWSDRISDNAFVDEVADFCLRVQQRMMSPEDLEDVAHARPDWGRVVQFAGRYRRALRAESRLDYPSLLAEAVRLLSEDPGVRSSLRRRFPHVLVDDAQEMSPAHVRLLAELAETDLCVAADPDSGVEKFRGAEPDWVYGFRAQFPGAQATVLSRSYRIGAPLGPALAGLAAHNEPDDGHRPASWASSPTHLECRVFRSVWEEVEAIAREFRRLHVAEGVGFDQMALLVSQPGRLLSAAQRALKTSEVPARAAFGDRSLSGAPSVRSFLNLARVALKAPGWQDLLPDLLSSQLIGLDYGTRRRLEREAWQAGRTLAEQVQQAPECAELRKLTDLAAAHSEFADECFYEVWSAASYFRRLAGAADRAAEGDPGMPPGSGGPEEPPAPFPDPGMPPDSGGPEERPAPFPDPGMPPGSGGPEELAVPFPDPGMPPGSGGPEERAVPFPDPGMPPGSGGPEELAVPLPELADELEALTAFSHSLGRFVERRRGKGSMLEYLSEAARADFGSGPDLSSSGFTGPAVTICSFHAAKGRQWDVVAVAGCVDSWIPKGSRAQGLFDPFALETPHLADRQIEALADDRRTFYVAASRARHKVIFTASSSAGGRGRPSRFLSELIGDLPEPSGPPELPPLSLTELSADLRRTLASTHSSSSDRVAALAVLSEIPGVDPSRWYGVRDWTPGSVPLVGGRLRTSYSRLSPYENCGLQYVLQSVLGLDHESTHSMKFGTWLHALFEAVHKGEIRDVASLKAEYARLFHEGIFPNRTIARQFRRDGEKMLKVFWENEVDRHTIRSEHFFEDVEVGGASIRGRIDRVDLLGKALKLTDYKTARWAPSFRHAERSLQLAIYHLAARQDQDLAELGHPEIARLVYPGALTRKGDYQVLNQTSEQADAVLRDLPDMVRRIVDEDFRPNPEADCYFCKMKVLCPLWPAGREVPG